MPHLHCTRSSWAYFAAPMQTFGESTYDVSLGRTRRRFPGATVLSSRDLFTSNREWCDQWPQILATISALVFITDRDEWIGRGVHQEILDAARLGIPVEYLAADGTFHQLADLELTAVGLRGWRQYARVRVRRPRVGRAR